MLCQGVIELWHGTLGHDGRRSDFYYDLLDREERLTADAMHRPLVRERYLEVRARLRLKLAEYSGQDARTIVLAKTEHGKPYLPDYPELNFNLSHSKDELLLAVTTGRQLGVDVETIRWRSGLSGIARKCFAESELRYWLALPKEQQAAAFFRFWTAKEAFVKATGRGIALGLNKVVIAEDAQLRLLAIPQEYGDPEQWSLLGVELGEGLSAAVCINSPENQEAALYPWVFTP